MRLSFSVLMSCCVSAAAPAEEPVYFADPNLKTAVERRLWVSDPTPADMLGLTRLTAVGMGIVDLTGVEYATNLQTLILRQNQISDISPLAGLTNLEELWINVNQISDISALSWLTNLRRLYIHDNWIGDLSPLSNLMDLEFLDFRNSQVSDISPLSGLTSLYFLDAFNNRISDVSPLLNLTNLEQLELRSNPLDGSAYCSHLQAICGHNPGLNLRYSPNHKAPADITVSKGAFPDRVRIAWEAVCSGPEYTSYYQVSRALSVDGPKVPVSEWQTALSFDDVTAETAVRYVYSVRTATSIHGSQAGDYSEPDGGWVGGVPTLTISSGAGGSVTMPGEGSREVQIGQVVDVRAGPFDPNLYFFAGWTGTGVEAGYIADANAASTAVTIDGTCTLHANFLTWMTTIYVDDDAPQDPGPHTAAVSDPCEDGTREHPFDKIQEGMNVALDGASAFVADGTYRECLVFGPTSITVTGFHPTEAMVPTPYPVIDANNEGTAVSFVHAEDSNPTLAGFVITRGQGDFAGAVRCRGSSPTVANCLIVGNRAINRYGAAVYCVDSRAVFVNCTIADNANGERSAGVYLFNSNVALTNSILCGNTPRDILVDGTSDPSITYTATAEGWPGMGNMVADPLFARPGWSDGDYHLQSQAGRWDPRTQAWAQDDATSLCIDAGDPTSSVAQEPVPNGGITNMGAYGGTPHASKSPGAP